MKTIKLIRTPEDILYLPKALPTLGIQNYLGEELVKYKPQYKYYKNAFGVERLEIDKKFYDEHKASFSLTGYRRIENAL